jgi:hypothetical protein
VADKNNGWKFTNWSLANDKVGATVTMSPVEGGQPGEREVTATLNQEVRPEGESASNQTLRDYGALVLGGGAVTGNAPAVAGGAAMVGLAELGQYLDSIQEE